VERERLMRTPMTIDDITGTVIGAAIAMHRALGPGLLERTYLSALCIELEETCVRCKREVVIPVSYRGRKVGVYRLDLVVEEEVIIEVKSVEYLHAVFEAQLLAYLRVTGMRVSLLINFNSPA
jgi:GxxExxY protein